jgi:type I restriction enzyme S subunit
LIVGSSYPAINSDDVANLKILLPPHEEQQKIADIFSLYDFAIKKIEQLIIMKEEYKKAIIQQMFDKRKIVKGINLEISNILSVVKREDDGKKIWELCT